MPGTWRKALEAVFMVSDEENYKVTFFAYVKKVSICWRSGVGYLGLTWAPNNVLFKASVSPVV